MTPPMMAGPRISPRRGFTMIEETNRARVGPVVVRLDDSPRSVVALRTGAEQARKRATDLVVIDQSGAEAGEIRSRAEVRSVLSDPRATVLIDIELEGDEPDIARECADLNASLLVIGRDQNADWMARLIEEVTSSACDLLVVADQTESIASSTAKDAWSSRRSQPR